MEEALETSKETVRSTWKENYLQGLVIGGGSALGAVLLGLGLFLLKKRRKRHEA
jgi:hypothetical protein